MRTAEINNLNCIFIHIGHGGREAAEFAKANLVDKIQDEPQFWLDDDNAVMKAIRKGFAATQTAMFRQRGK